MSTQHTSGPWYVIPAYATAPGGVQNSGGEVVADVFCPKKFNPLVIMREVEANARLIAAAPDLLASLQEIKAILSGGTYCVHRCDGEMMSLVVDGFIVNDIFERADKAIARATGEQESA